MTEIIQKKGSLVLYFILITFPLREAIAYSSNGTSFIRVGEVLFLFSPFIYIFGRKTDGIKSGVSNYCILLAMYSIVFGLCFASHLDSTYAYTFIARCIAITFFIKICEKLDFNVSPSFFEKLFKYTIIVEAILCSFQLTGHTLIGLKVLPYDSFIGLVPRLSGTASEPGFLIPVLSPSLYYFLSTYRYNKFWFWLTLLFMILSTSSFAYPIILFIFLYNAFNKSKSKAMKLAISYSILFFVAVIILITLSPSASDFVDYSINKILAFGSGSQDDMDYSGMERTVNRIAGFDGFVNMSVIEKFIGGGFGTALYYSEKYVVSYGTSNECGIAYLGMLLNLGILGLSILFALFKKVHKLKTKCIISTAIYIGFIVQAIQFLIITNIWIYFFWFEIGLLIILKRNENKIIDYERNKYTDL